jgi:hypothetical protein
LFLACFSCFLFFPPCKIQKNGKFFPSRIPIPRYFLGIFNINSGLLQGYAITGIALFYSGGLWKI